MYHGYPHQKSDLFFPQGCERTPVKKSEIGKLYKGQKYSELFMLRIEPRAENKFEIKHKKYRVLIWIWTFTEHEFGLPNSSVYEKCICPSRWKPINVLVFFKVKSPIERRLFWIADITKLFLIHPWQWWYLQAVPIKCLTPFDR